MKAKTILLVILVILTFLGSNAFAGRMWFFNPVEAPDGSPVGTGNTAIAMRSGNAWPVAGYTDGGGQNGVAVMMPGYWIDSPGGLSGDYLDGTTAEDGTVAFADSQGSIRMLSPYGFSNASYNGYVDNYRPSIAFNNNSNPSVLHNDNGNELYLTTKVGTTWYKTPVEDEGYTINTQSFALDFDSYNQANVAIADGGSLRFGSKGLTGDWVFSDGYEAPSISGVLDMVLTENDVPYVVYKESNELKYAIYDRHIDDWATGTLDTVNSNNFCIASDGDGGVGVAYVTLGMLNFAYNDGTDWMSPEILTAADISGMVGLAFDYEGNPVISYCDGYEMYIAYDPVENVPEPATIALLALGAILLRRRKYTLQGSKFLRRR